MDIKTGLSIYNKQWLIEPSAALQLLDFWENSKSNKSEWDYKKAIGESEGLSAYAIHKKFFDNKKVVMAPDNSYDMREFKGFDGATVAVIPITGPMMKSDYCGAFGSNTLKNLTQMASNTPSIKAIVFVHDSPGGMVNGTESFAATIAASPKLTISVADGYMLGAASDLVYASSRTAEIGCIGTMCAFYDNTEAMKARGIVLREYYATASADKNNDFREALKGNGKLLIEESLDPTNDIFLGSVKQFRNGKIDLSQENVLSGKVYIADAALKYGLIDGIKPLEEVIEEAMRGKEKTLTIKNLNIKNTNQMEGNTLTLAELKTQCPSVYEDAKKEGVNEERDRVTAALVFVAVDATAVTNLIKSGEMPTRTFFAEMAQKQFAATTLTAMEAGNRNAGTEVIPTTDPATGANISEADKQAEADRSKKVMDDYKKRHGIK